jgi:cytidyltransferase-like protein
MRFIPAVFMHTGISFSLTVLDVICDGFFMAVLTSDITLAKMAGREIHPWVVLMSMCAVLSHTTILALVIIYYIAVLGDLCAYMNMPLMTVCRNVYCDGVYDLCHIGHKILFKRALGFGNRLFVGVVGDEDASAYKRPPIMTAAERCAEVDGCKSVTKVISNAPCFGLTQDFLDEHQIHVVAMGEEYLEKFPNPDDGECLKLESCSYTLSECPCTTKLTVASSHTKNPSLIEQIPTMDMCAKLASQSHCQEHRVYQQAI